MMNPCDFGLKCPYMGKTDEQDKVCTFPVLPIHADENRMPPMMGDCSCGLMEWDSELYDILLAYNCDDNIQRAVKDYRKAYDERLDRMAESYRARFKVDYDWLSVRMDGVAREHEDMRKRMMEE